LGDEALKYDDLTQIIKDQFEYHPDKAKQLLAEAGYPNGFKTNVVCMARDADMLSIVKEYLAAVSVNLEIRVTEPGAFNSLKYGHTFDQCLTPTIGGVSWQSSPRGDLTNWYAPGIYDYSDWDDPGYMSRLAAAKLTTDEVKRKELYRKLAIETLEQAIYVLLPAPYTYTYWQPWVKGYQGQYGMTYNDMNMFKHWWLDLGLKEEIARQR
jgi:ABC-type transport system substrate-binding protein